MIKVEMYLNIVTCIVLYEMKLKRNTLIFIFKYMYTTMLQNKDK